MNENLGEFIRNSRNKKGLTLIEISWQFAKKTGKPIDPNYVSRLERGAILRPEKERLKIIAEILDINVDELYRLADYYPEVSEVQAEYREDMIEVPIGDISAGPGVMTQQTFYLPKNLIKSEKVVGYEVSGTSMEPDVPDGSYVAIDLENPAKVGDIVVSWNGEQGIIKRLVEQEGQMMLVGNIGDPIPVDDSVRIEGPVVFVGRFL